MAWPASSAYLLDAYQRANGAARSIKELTQELVDESTAGDVERIRVIAFYRYLINTINTLNSAKTVPGIGAYARIQLDDPSIDVAVEFDAMVAAATGLKLWIENNFPKGAGDALLLRTLNTSTGALEPMVFTSGQLAGFRTEAALLLVTID